MRVLLKGGRVVTPASEFTADVLIDGETVALLGASLEVEAERVIDAEGKLVLPGLVDVHTHLDQESDGVRTSDDFTSGTVSAAFGGTTSAVDFIFQERGQSLRDALAAWHGRLEAAPPVIDVGFHMTIVDLSVEGAVDDLAWLCEQGVTSYKLFMAYKDSIMVDDETVFATMLAAAENGALVLAHAENGDAIDALIRRARAAGHTDLIWHARTRPPETEAEATNRAIELAHLAGAPVYIVHMTCRQSVEVLARARANGRRAYGETCTQYLFIDESALEQPSSEAAKYVFTPPPRTKPDQEYLWGALANRTLSAVSTDHCPYDLAGQKRLGLNDFALMPHGAPGIEDRLMMLHHFGVRSGRLSLSRLVELTATEPARLFGLYPRKGTIAVGSDADIVVFDPEKPVTLSAKTHHSRVDHNLYEGVEVVGAPEIVFVRGTPVVEQGRLLVEAGHGRFLQRARFGELLRSSTAAVR
jgi:dihydropyrimidinase